MSMGLEVRGSAGVVRISSETYNWHLRYSRKLTDLDLTWYGNTGGSGDRYWAGFVSVTGLVNPVAAIFNPSGRAVAFRPSAPVGNVPVIQIFADDAARNSGEIFIFDMGFPSGSSGESFGLQVFDENGNIAFSTDRWPMKVVGRHSCRVTSISSGAYEESYVGAPIPARKMAAWAGRIESGAGITGVATGYHFIGTRRTGVGQVQYGGMLLLYAGAGLSPPMRYRSEGDSFVLIDVQQLPIPYG